ncbi:acetylxylan esterase [bacterium]|nr:acetylxylan esterase [bacterium]
MATLKQLFVVLVSFPLFLFPSALVFGQDRTVRVSVTNESKAGRVVAGEPTRFTATVQNRTDKLLTAKLRWDVHTVAFDAPKSSPREIQIEGRQSKSFDYELICKSAGFADVEVSVTDGKNTTTAHSRVVNSPEDVESPLTKESDFDEFWRQSLRNLSEVAPNFEVIARPDMNGKNADVFEVKFRGFGNVRVAGWLELPRTPGPHPVVVRVPGYGQNMRPIDRWDDMIVFSFNPRGHGNSTEDIPGKPHDYWIRGLDNKTNYYYRGAYLDCVRAVEYVASRDDVDRDRIAVWGGSQGGGFAFSTAALCPDVDLCVGDIPFLCDWVNYFKLSHWPEMDEWIAASPKRTWESTLRTLSYFDTMNLADRIRCRTIMGVGLQDKICPPTTSFAAFNRIPAEASFKIYEDAGHGLGPKHWEWVWTQIRSEFKVDKNAVADEWPQWLGPNREPIWHATGIVKKFPEDGPPLRWKAPIGSGYSGPAVTGGRVFVMDRDSSDLNEGEVLHEEPPKNKNFLRRLLPGNERVVCLDETTGKQLWKHEYDCPYSTVALYAIGPRCTPTVDGDYVYTLGAEGRLTCLQVVDGKPVWSLDFKEKYNVEVPEWGFAGHPLIDGDLLICVVGGKGATCVAFDKKTGEQRWSALSSSKPGYCPPVIHKVGSERHLVVWHGDAVDGLNPQTGEVYWSVPFKATFGMSVGAPQIEGRSMFIMCFNRQSALIQIGDDNRSAKVVWEGNAKRGIGGVLNTAVLAGGHIYACGNGGRYICAELSTGKQLWSTFAMSPGTRPSSWGNAFTVRNGSRYFHANDVGDLIIATMSPEGFREISRTHLIDPTNHVGGRKLVWSHPAFANRSIYLRNDREIRCYSLQEKAE